MGDSDFLELLVLADQFEDEGNHEVADDLRAQAQELFEQQETDDEDESDEDARPDYTDPDYEGFYDVPEEWYDHDYDWDDFADDYGDIEETETDS